MLLFGFTLYQIAFYFLIYSFLGWCCEVVYAAFVTGQLVNRGFLNGPVCPIYGFGMLTLLFFLTPLVHRYLLLFFWGMILPSAIELAGGWMLYKVYHTRWWDYTDKPFNLGGYICLEFCFYWGIGSVVMMKLVHPAVAMLVGAIPPTAGWVILAICYLVYAADLVVTTITAIGLTTELDTLEQVADGIHAISDAMTGLIGSTALDADQKLDESRLQLKLAGAELSNKLSRREMQRATRAARAKAAEAMEAARRAGETARMNAAEAAEAARLAAAGKMDQASELLRLEGLRAELEARSEEIQAQMRAQFQRTAFLGPGRMIKAFPRLRHGSRRLSLDALRELLRRKDSGQDDSHPGPDQDQDQTRP